MNLFRARPAYPKDRDLVRVVQAAASRLADKLESLDLASLDLSMDTRHVFEHHRNDLRPYIERCAHVFAWSLPRDERPFTDLSVVAFDDGIGLFSLLAKKCNIGTVVYHGSNDILRCDAGTIARAIGHPADYYVFGDTEELEFVAKRYSIACDVLVSSRAFTSRDAGGVSRGLIPFLNTLSEPSTGAISFGLAIEEGPLLASPGQTSADEIDSLSSELGRAGFEVNVVRGPVVVSLRSSERRTAGQTGATHHADGGHPFGSSDGSGRALVISGSRPEGTYAPDGERTSIAASPHHAAAPKGNAKSREVLIG